MMHYTITDSASRAIFTKFMYGYPAYAAQAVHNVHCTHNTFVHQMHD